MPDSNSEPIPICRATRRRQPAQTGARRVDSHPLAELCRNARDAAAKGARDARRTSTPHRRDCVTYCLVARRGRWMDDWTEPVAKRWCGPRSLTRSSPGSPVLCLPACAAGTPWTAKFWGGLPISPRGLQGVRRIWSAGLVRARNRHSVLAAVCIAGPRCPIDPSMNQLRQILSHLKPLVSQLGRGLERLRCCAQRAVGRSPDARWQLGYMDQR
jgi:hypothetical protein